MNRTINPGHCIETSWFIMEEAKLRGWDKPMFDMALQIFDWSWDWGWDKRVRRHHQLPRLQEPPGAGLFAGHEVLVAAVRDHHRFALCLPRLPATRSISIATSASASGHTPTSPMPSTASGMAICTATAPWHSPPRAISSRVRSTFRA